LWISEDLDNAKRSESDDDGSCSALQICCEKKKAKLEGLPPPTVSFPAPKQCGYRNAKGLGGELKSLQNRTMYAQFAEFPWMVAVIEVAVLGNLKLPVHVGGGSLIHPKVVLSAAHKIVKKDPKKLVVRAGEWDTQTENEMVPHQERKVQKVIAHEDFNPGNKQNSILLLILDNAFEMTAFINTICLPPKGMNFDNQRCFTSGWGKDKFGSKGVHQAFLKKIDLPMVEHSKCQEMFRKTRLGSDFILHEGFVCAGGEKGKDACTGDGGAPLMCEVNDQSGYYFQAGLVVGGVGCGEQHVPGFYAGVS
jgi:plasma kallikrein